MFGFLIAFVCKLLMILLRRVHIYSLMAHVYKVIVNVSNIVVKKTISVLHVANVINSEDLGKKEGKNHQKEQKVVLGVLTNKNPVKRRLNFLEKIM